MTKADKINFPLRPEAEGMKSCGFGSRVSEFEQAHAYAFANLNMLTLTRSQI